MNETSFPEEIVQEQNNKTNILYKCLDFSVYRIMFVMLTFMGFVSLVVLVNIIICIIVIYLKG